MPQRGCGWETCRKGSLCRPTVYIGRNMGKHIRSVGWRNPFCCGRHPTAAKRRQAVASFRKYLSSNGRLLFWLEDLGGKRLACHCPSGVACHGDALIEAWIKKYGHLNTHLPACADFLTRDGRDSRSGFMWSHGGDVLGLQNWLRSSTSALGQFAQGQTEEPHNARRAVSPFLPLPRGVEAKELSQGLEGRVGQPLPTVGVPALPAAEVLWRDLVVVGVNYLRHLGPGSDEEEGSKATRQASSLQQLCGQNIARDVRWFTQNECVSPHGDWGPRLKIMRLDYDGAEVRSPEPLTWRQVASALPKAGHGARIVASEISEEWMRDVFDDPLHSLLPRSAWPKCAGAAKVWVQNEAEWVKIIRGMAANKLVDFLRPGERFFWGGSPLGIGSFCVTKKNKTIPDGRPVLRMICNAIPSNEFFRSQADDIGMLPYFGQLQGVELQCDVGSEDSPRVCLWAEEDMVSSFNLFRKGRAWLPFQAFSKGVLCRAGNRPG